MRSLNLEVLSVVRHESGTEQSLLVFKSESSYRELRSTESLEELSKRVKVMRVWLAFIKSEKKEPKRNFLRN